jgi:hypothetical protein
LLHKGLAAANARLAEECHKQGRGLLLPFGSINPMLPAKDVDARPLWQVAGRFAGVYQEFP